PPAAPRRPRRTDPTPPRPTTLSGPDSSLRCSCQALQPHSQPERSGESKPGKTLCSGRRRGRETLPKRGSREGRRMRTTINLDDSLLDEARRIAGTNERTALIHEGLRALIQRESARRLARLGG